MARWARWTTAALGIGVAGFAMTASAQTLDFHVDINTSGLNPASTYYAEFSMSDGSVSGGGTSANNSALLSQFTFGGGAAGAILPPTIGTASGDMTTGITLADDPGGVSDLAQGFSPGSALDFNVHLTTNAIGGQTPDEFLVRLLDSSFNYLTTNDPTLGENGFVVVNLSSSRLGLGDVQAYGTTTGSIPTPTISAVPSTTPEPGLIGLLTGSGVFSLVALRRKGRRMR